MQNLDYMVSRMVLDIELIMQSKSKQPENQTVSYQSLTLLASISIWSNM